MSNNRRHKYQGNQRGGVEGGGRSGGRKPYKSHIQCYNCQKCGHYSSDYSEKRKNQESDAKFAKHEEEETLMMVTTRDEEKFKDQWYLDSGCSSHMSGRKDWFVNLNPSIKNMVKFANDNTLVAEGIGDVMIMRERWQRVNNLQCGVHSKHEERLDQHMEVGKKEKRITK